MAAKSTTLQLNANGESLSVILPSAPFAYQVTGASLQGETLTLDLHAAATAPFPPAAPEDNPADLLYGTFLGGGQTDRGLAIAMDSASNAYVTGTTASTDFPTTPGVLDPSLSGGEDAFMVRLGSTGSGLVYATFLGGANSDVGYAITVDGTDNAYVTGITHSSDFPATSGSFDPIYTGGATWGGDAFVAKLNSTGSTLVYSTFLGGSGDPYGDRGLAIAVDTAGSAYVAGQTNSSDFPTTSAAFDPSYNGGETDAFIVKLNPTGSALAYASFLGGSDWESGWAIALDETRNAYVTGATGSYNFPSTPGAFDVSFNGGDNSFVIKLNPSGSELAYATFLDGSGLAWGLAIAVDGTDNAYVAGMTSSSDFPTTPAVFDPSFNGGFYDAFLVKFNAAGNGLVYATFIGGSSDDGGYLWNEIAVSVSIAVDEVGNAFLTGNTYSEDFPTTPGAFDQSHNGGDRDAFVAKLNPTASTLLFATYLGGSGRDESHSIAIDETGRAYVTGGTSSSDFPFTPAAFDPSYNGGGDAFVANPAATSMATG